MPEIHLTTFIAAPAERVFDLCRSINLHRISALQNGEKVISGVLNGLINLNETVTWQARHLYKTRQFTSQITAMQRPDFFIEEMIKGDLTRFQHQHHFKQAANGTIMIDLVNFETPHGLVGRIANRLFLYSYIEKFIIKRNQVIKSYAESLKWKALLS